MDDNGLSVFDLLRYRRHDHAATLCAFDLIEVDGTDLWRNPIEERKGCVARLLQRGDFGVAINEIFAGDGPMIYNHACALGCEGVVSKRLGSTYRMGRTDVWRKTKNPGRQPCGVNARSTGRSSKSRMFKTLRRHSKK